MFHTVWHVLKVIDFQNKIIIQKIHIQGRAITLSTLNSPLFLEI